ncbi:MAG TPA: hypothetical protein VGB63_07455 [Pedobacter sp.]
MKRILFLLLLLCFSQRIFSQEKQVQGIVFDADSKQRLSRVYIYNTRTHKGFYNNIKGEFTTTAKAGDILVAALQGFAVDTVTVKSQAAVLFYLKRTGILLKEVSIKDTTLSAKERLKRSQEEFKDAYRKGSTKDLLQIGGPNGTGGAGLGIDAIWSLLSREGKNARYLQKIIEADYRDQMIRYRFSQSLVSRVTGLTDDALTDFMVQYKPSYNFILEASDYVLIGFIRNSFERYKRKPGANRLPPLVPVTLE